MPENKSGRRIIAIAVSPTAYDEIQRLKGTETWTSFVTRAVDTLVGGNETLQAELASLPKHEPKAKKPKAKKTGKAKQKAEKPVETPETQPLVETGSE